MQSYQDRLSCSLSRLMLIHAVGYALQDAGTMGMLSAGWKATVTALVEKFGRVISAANEEAVEEATGGTTHTDASDNLPIDIFSSRLTGRSSSMHERHKIRLQFLKVGLTPL